MKALIYDRVEFVNLCGAKFSVGIFRSHYVHHKVRNYGLYSNAETFSPMALGGIASNTLLMDEHNMLVY